MNCENADSCLVLSIPRSGTHVVMQILNSLGMKEYPALAKQDDFWTKWDTHIQTIPDKGYFCFGNHAYPGKARRLVEANRKGVFISRDPRDWAVSYGYHFRLTSGFKHIYEQFGINRLFEESIKRFPGQLKRLKWRDYPNVYSTTFERLFQNSFEEFTNICNFLGIKITKKEIRRKIKELNSSSPKYKKNFRRGVVGDWRNYLLPEHMELCKKLLGQHLIDEGYEKDLDW